MTPAAGERRRKEDVHVPSREEVDVYGEYWRARPKVRPHAIGAVWRCQRGACGGHAVCRFRALTAKRTRKDLLMDIGTEELSHLEVVGALIRMHLKPMKSDREAAEADPLVAIAGGCGVSLFDSMGNAWTADYLKVTGDLAVDLRSNIAAEARAKIVYERLIGFTQDQGSKEALQFLMTREITHMRAFTAALDSMEKPQFSVGIIQPTPGLVDQFFNGSTGESQYGEADFVGPWNHSNGLIPVESEIKGGEGLDVTPYTPEPGTEVTSPIDSTTGWPVYERCWQETGYSSRKGPKGGSKRSYRRGLNSRRLSSVAAYILSFSHGLS